MNKKQKIREMKNKIKKQKTNRCDRRRKKILFLKSLNKSIFSSLKHFKILLSINHDVNMT